ncbi:Spore germination protein B3 [Sporomusa silvacetica DSM 10669]|uniref:Spore germination protein B3 n=1 Tax=Sporomusa silvacetica DSM 10669 TaxID=1123289 RepID=A0ABZ3IL03_9FIRM|nr:Ger(x)C family spore germination protein [Sporomusa silvacetica]OZC17557.1 spore germination protein B3 precursor [Sporomusa silvacetica DSM 10669]
MKKIVIIGMLIAAITLTGCWSAKELNTMSLVMGVGIDKTTELDHLLLTAQVAKPEAVQGASSDGKKGSGGKAYSNISMVGDTVFEAIRKTTHIIGKRLFFTHNEIVILGRSLAEDGLENVIDFFLRDHELRPNMLVAVATENAADIFAVDSETEKLPITNIIKTIRAHQYASHFTAVTIFDLTEQLMSETTTPVVPLLSITQSRGVKEVEALGMAVFKYGKMVGILNETETRGLLWVKGDVKGGSILIDSPDGKGKVSLEISKADSEIKPEIRNGQVIMHIKISESAALAEQTTEKNLATLEFVKDVERLQANVIKQEILAALNKSKQFNSDIFGFGNIVYRKFPNDWQIFRHQWDKVYTDIDCVIDVDAKIRSTGTLSDTVQLRK